MQVGSRIRGGGIVSTLPSSGDNSAATRLAVILPAYNEEQTIVDTIENFRRALPSAAIWVVNNRSTDATVNDRHPCQRIDVMLNEHNLRNLSLCSGAGGENATLYKFGVTPNMLREDGGIEIRFITPDSMSPKALRISQDDRVLGMGIRSLRIKSI